MKRRSFIIASFFSLVGAGVFSFMQWARNSGKVNTLNQPKFLLQLCDRNTIQMLGRAYLKLKPEERRNDLLLNDLVAEKSSKGILDRQHISRVESQIEKRINHDFD